MIYLGILLAVGVGFVLAFIVMQYLGKKQAGTMADTLEKHMHEMFPKLMQQSSEQLILMANERLSAEKREIKTDLDNKKNTIEMIVKEVRSALEQSNKRLEDAERDRVGSFRALKEEMEQHRKITDQLSVSTEGLRKVLSNNQLRGQFGEQVAENLLKMAGFVRGTDYEYNKVQENSGRTRPDFTIFLPDGSKINIDAKFPYANLQRVVDTQDEHQKKAYMQAFQSDIKAKIKQVTTRDYINPEDKTVDFVIMFIPNEMIFSFIYDKMNEVWSEAMRQKVVFAGPFSFTAILQMVRQAHDNFKYQNNVQKIIGYIKSFEEEFRKYHEEFLKIGKKLEDTTRQFETVKTTRFNQLNRSMDKIKLENSKDVPLLPDEPATML